MSVGWRTGPVAWIVSLGHQTDLRLDQLGKGSRCLGQGYRCVGTLGTPGRQSKESRFEVVHNDQCPRIGTSVQH